jgi:hypothetical protein
LHIFYHFNFNGSNKMKKSNIKLKLSVVLAVTAIFFGHEASAGVCPDTTVLTSSDSGSYGNSTGCNVQFTINNNTVGIAAAVGNYDGTEDVEVGVTNNSSNMVSALTISGSWIFGFDGDGISTYTNIYVLGDTSGYAGPGTSFSNISNNYSLGQVNFTGGLAPGASAYFSLEGAPGTASAYSAHVGAVSAVPEPSTYAMLLAGLGLIGFIMYRSKEKATDMHMAA